MDFFIVVLVLIIIVLLAIAAKTKAKPEISVPYELAKPLLSPAERSFFGVLNQACKDKAIVFVKVRVADIIKPIGGLNRSQWRLAFNRIASKHFDFVICKPTDLSLICVVELDDASHDSKNCPKCSAELVTKTATRGKNKGNSFLACSSYPSCKYTQDMS